VPNRPLETRAEPETRERILDAAEELFARRGLAGTAMRDIAKQVGLTAASLYNHFEGKQGLYEAVLERGVRPLIGLMRGLPSREHTPSDMEAMIEAIMAHLERRPHLPQLIQHEVIGGGVYLARIARSWIRPILTEGIAEMKRDPHSRFTEEEFPLVMSAWLNLVFGHFAMAPLMREIFAEDPLSPANIERQTRFLRKFARLMMTTPPGAANQHREPRCSSATSTSIPSKREHRTHGSRPELSPSD
jgi:TetR/AcrR family transcriptional regulator